MTRSEVSILSPLPKPKNFERQIKKDYLFDTIWRWIDPKLFYNKLLGYKGNFINAFEKGEVKSLQLFNDIKIVKSIVKNSKTGLMTPKALCSSFNVKKKKT